jgi:hypothetical protein
MRREHKAATAVRACQPSGAVPLIFLIECIALLAPPAVTLAIARVSAVAGHRGAAYAFAACLGIALSATSLLGSWWMRTWFRAAESRGALSEGRVATGYCLFAAWGLIGAPVIGGTVTGAALRALGLGH